MFGAGSVCQRCGGLSFVVEEAPREGSTHAQDIVRCVSCDAQIDIDDNQIMTPPTRSTILERLANYRSRAR